MNATIHPRNAFNDPAIILPPDIGFRIVYYNGAIDAFGYQQTNLEIQGSQESAWTLFNYLGAWLKLWDDHGQLVWYGIVDELLINVGWGLVGYNITDLYNTIQLVYTERQPDGTEETSYTDWYQSTDSVTRFGLSEMRQSIGPSNATAAAQRAQKILSEVSSPQPVTLLRSMNGVDYVGTLRGIGPGYIFRRQYFANLTGRETNLANSERWPLGNQYTATNIAFGEDDRIQAVSGQVFKDFGQPDMPIIISGSTSNDGTYVVTRSGNDRPIITASTLIEFDPTDDINGIGLAVFKDHDWINVSGSAANSGIRYITAAEGDTHITVEVPPNIVAEAAGPAITISGPSTLVVDSHTFTKEAPGATITMTVPGLKIAQRWFSTLMVSGSDDWNIKLVYLRGRKVGSPTSNVTLKIYDDNSGAIGTLIESITVAHTAFNSSDPDAVVYVPFVFTGLAEIQHGAWYWFVVEVAGYSFTNYYELDLSVNGAYGSNSLKLWNGSAYVNHPTDTTLTLAFQVFDSIDSVDLLVNVLNKMKADVIVGVDNFITSDGLPINQYREGEAYANVEVRDLIEAGDNAGRSIMVIINNERRAKVMLVPEAQSEPYILRYPDGSLRSLSNAPISRTSLPLGQIVRHSPLIALSANNPWAQKLMAMVVGMAEFRDQDALGLYLEPHGRLNSWDRPTLYNQ